MDNGTILGASKYRSINTDTGEKTPLTQATLNEQRTALSKPNIGYVDTTQPSMTFAEFRRGF